MSLRKIREKIREKQLVELSQVRIAAPCTARWDEMVGDEKVRFCADCKLNVYNLSAMDVEEAAEVIASREQRVCLRLYRRTDGTIITRDCPEGVRLRERLAALAVRRRRSIALKALAGLAVGGALAAALVPVHEMGTRSDPTAAERIHRRALQRDILHLAAAEGHVDELQRVLEDGAAPDPWQPGARTPLMEAASGGHLEAVRSLLEYGADPARTDEQGRTALNYAEAAGRAEVAALLRASPHQSPRRAPVR